MFLETLANIEESFKNSLDVLTEADDFQIMEIPLNEAENNNKSEDDDLIICFSDSEDSEIDSWIHEGQLLKDENIDEVNKFKHICNLFEKLRTNKVTKEKKVFFIFLKKSFYLHFLNLLEFGFC